MRISETGLDLIKHFEGLRLNAYKCPAGVWTIGYGSTGSHVTPDLKITEEEAERLLRHDLGRFEHGVEELVKVDLAQDEFDALVSFAFNLGLGALEQSTLLRLLNQSKRMEAAAQFARWDKAGGKPLPGLTKRRRAEAALFRGDDWRTA